MYKYDFVLTASSYYPVTGGVENSIYNLSKELNNQGFRPLIVTTDNRLIEKVNQFEFKIENIQNQKVIRYHYYKNPLLQLISGFFIIVFINLKYSPKYFICRDNLHAFITALIKIKTLYLIPGLCLHELHNKNSLRIRGKKFIHFYAIKKSMKIAVLSKFMQNDLVKYYKRKPLLIKPGFNKPINYDNKKIISKYSLISIGRFVKHKNFSMLLKAFSLLPKEFDLTLIGYGVLKDELSNLIKNLNISERVKFISNGENANLYYNQSSIYVLPSIYEPFGQVLLEAMSYGLKVCAFDPSINNVHTATNEIVPDFCLFLAKKLTSKSLSKTIKIASAANINKSKISNYVNKNYSWLNFSRDILKQFEIDSLEK